MGWEDALQILLGAVQGGALGYGEKLAADRKHSDELDFLTKKSKIQEEDRAEQKQQDYMDKVKLLLLSKKLGDLGQGKNELDLPTDLSAIDFGMPGLSKVLSLKNKNQGGGGGGLNLGNIKIFGDTTPKPTTPKKPLVFN